MSDLYEARNSIYCYENSNILKNKFNIQDSATLEEIERRIVLAKLYELRQKTTFEKLNMSHFVEIHRYLFEDIYPFAGLFRSENIAKGNFCFAEWQYIEEQLQKLMQDLEKENYLIGLNKEKLSKRLAYYMSELNVLHPFREGNGRTIREFIRQLAYKNNYILNFQNLNPKEMLDACIKSVTDIKELQEILYYCLEEKK